MPAAFRSPTARLVLAACLALTACDARSGETRPAPGAPAGGVDSSGPPTAAADPSLPATAAPTRAASGDDPVAALARDDGDAPAIRALYVNRFAAITSRRLRHLIALADSTEINALVIDGKDEMGLAFHSASPEFARNAGVEPKIRDVRALTDTLRAHGILPIARVVVFKDPVAAEVHPEWTIRRPDGSIWRDHKGLAWIDPYNRAVWDYNLGIAEELVRLGFGEVQFDYIRFPEPYRSLPRQVFPAGSGQSKPDAITEFLRVADERLGKLGVRSTADVFGLVTTVQGPLEVAQHWEKLAPVTDVLLPMVYPSHYPRGSFGVARPNAEPYRIVHVAIGRARARNEKLGLRGERVRPYLQAFSLGKPPYGAEELRQQKQAVYDAGYDGWVLWHPGTKYEAFEAALERGETVSRRKATPTPPAARVE